MFYITFTLPTPYLGADSPTVSHYKPNLRLCNEVFGFLHFCRIHCLFQCNTMGQFMLMQNLPWLQSHHYCINLNEAAREVANRWWWCCFSLIKTTTYHSIFHRLPLTPTPHTTVQISKCRSSIYKVSENVSVPQPMTYQPLKSRFQMTCTFIVLHCSAN